MLKHITLLILLRSSFQTMAQSTLTQMCQIEIKSAKDELFSKLNLKQTKLDIREIISKLKSNKSELEIIMDPNHDNWFDVAESWLNKASKIWNEKNRLGKVFSADDLGILIRYDLDLLGKSITVVIQSKSLTKDTDIETKVITINDSPKNSFKNIEEAIIYLSTCKQNHEFRKVKDPNLNHDVFELVSKKVKKSC